MTDPNPFRDTILAQVRRGLALNRTPGLHFAGNLLDLSFEKVTPEESRLVLPAGPWATDADGQINIGALSLLADIAISACIRAPLPRNARLGTVSLHLQFSGVPRHGPLTATGDAAGVFAGGTGRLGHARVTVSGASGPVCHGTGSFMRLVPPKDMVLAPVPLRTLADPPPAEVADEDLDEDERAILGRAIRVLDDRTAADPSFAGRFFGFDARPVKGGASGRMVNGPHIANRVRHVQGGLSFALAAVTAQAALPGAWALSNITASYVSPGDGDVLRARAKIIHQGGLTAVVRTRVVRPDRRIVLDVHSNHLRLADTAQG